MYTIALILLVALTQSAFAEPQTVTGEARVSVTLNPVRAERLARDMAERDAKRKILQSAYGKPLPKDATLAGEFRNVNFSTPEHFEKDGRRMVRIIAQYNPADIGPVELVKDGRVDVRLDDTVTGLLESHPPLLNGGAHLFWNDDGWLCVGVGFAPIEQGEAKARRAAEVAADAKITETVFGVVVDVKETDIEKLVDLGGFTELRREVHTIIRQEAEGALKLVQTAGSWHRAEEIAVVRVVGVPAVQLAGMDQPIQVRDLEMEDDWRKVLRNYPTLLSGGATLAEKDGIIYLVAVGSAPAGNRAEIVARADAQRAILKFANGFTILSNDVSREELITVERERKEEILRDTEEAIRRISQQASGVVPGLIAIGHWRSADGDRIFVAFAAKPAK